MVLSEEPRVVLLTLNAQVLVISGVSTVYVPKVLFAGAGPVPV